MLSQGINQSANFRFLSRLSDRALFLPVYAVVHGKWLPAESVRVILLPAETLDRDQSSGQSRQEAISADSSFGREQEIADSTG